jgi:hypothetical protein
MKRIVSLGAIHNQITEAAVSTAQLVEDYRHVVVDVLTAGATGNMKVKVSNQDAMPDFAAPATVTNQWSYIDLKGRNDGGTTVVGTSGLTLTATGSNSYAVNTDAVRWIAVDMEVLSAGTASVLLSGATNE